LHCGTSELYKKVCFQLYMISTCRKFIHLYVFLRLDWVIRKIFISNLKSSFSEYHTCSRGFNNRQQYPFHDLYGDNIYESCLTNIRLLPDHFAGSAGLTTSELLFDEACHTAKWSSTLIVPSSSKACSWPRASLLSKPGGLLTKYQTLPRGRNVYVHTASMDG